MNISGIELLKVRENLWEIPASGKMKVPGRIYISQEMIEKGFKDSEALKQVANVAQLPGIEKYSLAMPDIHWGYGFPIGGVAATNLNEGVVSPGGVGYDINCGVRLATTNLEYNSVKKRTGKLVEKLFKAVPTGVGASGAIKRLSTGELKKVLSKGSAWALENDLGTSEDVSFTEESGTLRNADSNSVSKRAYERGADQVGTLGSGNHFLEVDVVEEIFNAEAAEIFGMFLGQVVIQIHTGSRGLGYQVCDDYLKILLQVSSKYGFNLPDRQLACAPIKSQEGQDYLSAMQAAANFAWNNRQVIMHLTKKVFKDTFNQSDSELGFNLVYDVCHNIAKIEKHKINGGEKEVCVHRKGATRAFPSGSKLIPEKYRSVGQPVLIPGDMGRNSYVAVGTEKAMEETFGSSCHGAGRNLSRKKAMKNAKGRNLIEELKQKGIVIQAKGYRTIAEEMPDAYKDVLDVVNVMHTEGITKKVAKLRPVGVIKG
ncbi:MAG: RtcB family protein [Ignavibacteria bacterium]|nr:RtcB family protein [Ignavibacteria bacterium]MBT8383176.1 RtcB family protein [Ignavibacteria bacterium]MBT8390820.1 RtcB family protein [Ignavibacteria bacterium]NNJ53285.1 RtcB family protein [Ignavibacteriaceae bacterium]NNL20863.1 RtcB family protein [Ignavibacteriaceae bacterium]